MSYRQPFHKRPRVEYQGPREASIQRGSKDGWLNVSFTFDPHCITDIKAYIDSGGRRWNPDTKFWEIKEIHLGTLITILKKHFEDNVTQNLTTVEKAPLNVFKGLFDVLKTMPNGSMDKVYTSLAFAIHPDRGGSDTQMKLLNEAYQEAKNDNYLNQTRQRH